MHVHLIANPYSGQGKTKKFIPYICQLLAISGITYEIDVTRRPGQASDLARLAARKSQVVGVIGGDGTVGEVTNGLINTNTTLAIIPTGTGNDLARGLGIPLNLEASVRLLKTGQKAYLDLLMDRDRIMVGAGAIGYACQVIQRFNAIRNGFIKGPAAFFAAAVITLAKLQSFPVEVVLDGRKIQREIVAMFFMNSPSIGGGMRMAPHAHMADGYIDVVLINKVGKLDLLTTLPRVYKGTHCNHRQVEMFSAQRLEIMTTTPMPKLFDGEFCGMTPLVAAVWPSVLPVLVPQATASQLGSQTKKAQ